MMPVAAAASLGGCGTVLNGIKTPQDRNDWREGHWFDQRQGGNYRQIDYRQYRGLR
jgi:hypothetical protein